MILGGRVSVNGEVRTRMPVMIDPAKDIVTVDDERVGNQPHGLKEQQKVYFLLNKPKGILVTNNDPSGRKTVSELMTRVKERVFPVGRLDMDARGALLMTNDGELANRLTHPRFGVEKIYIVEVDGRVGHGEIEKIKRGIWLAGPADAGARKTERFGVKLVGRERGRTILELKISEAKNSDIRRALARLGHTVRDLNRVAIAGKITLKGLEPGEFRPLSEAEVKWLFHASSQEFHGERQAATQQWYEAKEMEKERKRLAREGTEEATKVAAPKRVPEQSPGVTRAPAKSRNEKERKPRPERKGRKPFVPPTGRNAGKPLGGNYIGKRRHQQEVFEADPTENETPSAPPVSNHPLGFEARDDD
jgi:23S rRNA pseudouridine2605 synthase